MDLRKIFEDKEEQSIFIKTAAKIPVDSSQKAVLNRRGNALFNSGDIEGARRIFLTTGYSDGLARIGDQYKSEGRLLDALRMYWIAPDRRKAEPIIMQMAQIIQNLLEEGENNYENEKDFFLRQTVSEK
jgi:hypothetical protein